MKTYLFINSKEVINYSPILANCYRSAVRDYLTYCGDLTPTAEIALRGCERDEDCNSVLTHFASDRIYKVYTIEKTIYDEDIKY